MQQYAITEVYANKCKKYQFCKLVALTNGAVTQDMSRTPEDKLQNTLSNYQVSNKIKY